MGISKYLYFFVLLGLVTSTSSYACSIGYKRPEYINVMKMYGKKNPDIKVYEAVYALGYEGTYNMKVFSEKMELLISHEDGKICAHNPEKEPACMNTKGTGIDLRAIHNFETGKRNLRLFIQIDDAPLEHYVFKKTQS